MYTKKTVEFLQNSAKLPQERFKTLTKYLVFTHPKNVTFCFWTSTFGVLNIKVESYKCSCFSNSQQPKKSLKPFKKHNFFSFKSTQISADQEKSSTRRNWVESYKFKIFLKVNIRKISKKLTKSFVFKHPTMTLFLDQDL